MTIRLIYDARGTLDGFATLLVQSQYGSSGCTTIQKVCSVLQDHMQLIYHIDTSIFTVLGTSTLTPYEFSLLISDFESKDPPWKTSVINGNIAGVDKSFKLIAGACAQLGTITFCNPKDL